MTVTRKRQYFCKKPYSQRTVKTVIKKEKNCQIKITISYLNFSLQKQGIRVQQKNIQIRDVCEEENRKLILQKFMAIQMEALTPWNKTIQFRSLNRSKTSTYSKECASKKHGKRL